MTVLTHQYYLPFPHDFSALPFFSSIAPAGASPILYVAKLQENRLMKYLVDNFRVIPCLDGVSDAGRNPARSYA
jgi:hypothetical protein